MSSDRKEYRIARRRGTIIYRFNNKNDYFEKFFPGILHTIKVEEQLERMKTNK